MLRNLLLVTASAALAGSALAAEPPAIPPPLPPVSVFSWTGVYVGGQVGYAWAKNNVTFNDNFGDFTALSYRPDGVIGGGHVGYNMEFNHCCFVAGIEGDVDGTSLSKQSNSFVPFGGSLAGAGVITAPLGGNLNVNVNHNIEGSIRGRIGFALAGLGWDRILVYGTGGVAFGGFSSTVSGNFPGGAFVSAPGAAALTFPPFGGSTSTSTTRVGWTVGGGLEYAMTDNWSLRAEYRYTDFGRSTIFLPTFDSAALGAAGASVNRHFTENSVQIGFSYKFGPPPPPPVVAKF